jgi:hypothetical protein
MSGTPRNITVPIAVTKRRRSSRPRKNIFITARKKPKALKPPQADYAHNRRRQTVELTQGVDQQVDEMILSPDGKTVYFTAGKCRLQRRFSAFRSNRISVCESHARQSVVPNGFYSNKICCPTVKL